MESIIGVSDTPNVRQDIIKIFKKSGSTIKILTARHETLTIDRKSHEKLESTIIDKYEKFAVKSALGCRTPQTYANR